MARLRLREYAPGFGDSWPCVEFRQSQFCLRDASLVSTLLLLAMMFKRVWCFFLLPGRVVFGCFVLAPL